MNADIARIREDISRAKQEALEAIRNRQDASAPLKRLDDAVARYNAYMKK